jgi:copper homeostasis protein
MTRILEVIVTSLDEAIEAEAGGADRLELVSALEVGGLSPAPELVRAVAEAVRIPVRVMLRREPALRVGRANEVDFLQQTAASFARFPIDGLVLGFVRNHAIDQETTQKVLSAAPSCAATFHRAFDEVADPAAAIAQIRHISQIDRILTTGGSGDWPERKRRLLAWQRAAYPGITVLVATGLCQDLLGDLKNGSELREIHVGRAARLPHTVSGAVSREAVRSLKSALQ